MRKTRLAAIKMRLLAGAVAVASMASAVPALAQQTPSVTQTQARERAAAARSKIEDLKGGSYIDAARQAADRASQELAAKGEGTLAAEFALEAVNLSAATENWQHIQDEYFPRYAEIAADLDKADPRKGDEFLSTMVQFKSALGDRPGRQAIADTLLQRARMAGGPQGERALNAEFLIAFAWMQADGQEGYDKLNAMLAVAEKTNLDAFTIARYTDAAEKFRASGYLDVADELLNRALLTEAAKRAPKELGDTYLKLAMVKEAMGDVQNAYQLYVQAANTLDQRFGTESLEQLYASDKLAVFTSRLGSPASSTNRASNIYRIARRVLGENHHETWKFANNYADMLREIGASARAIDLDAFVMEKRIGKYGPNHYNVMVSANNMGQTFLNLGRYDEARKYFRQHRDIAIALNREDAGYAIADGWLLYTDLVSGAVPMDERQAEAMEAIAGSGQYAEILRFKTAKQAATWRAQQGETAMAISTLNDATKLAEQSFSPVHPLTFDLRLDIAKIKAVGRPDEAASDFAKLSSDMQDWMARDVSGAGNRFTAEASRALSDDFLFAYAAFAESYPAAQPAFADAAFRWASAENGKRDPLRRIARALPPDDVEMRQFIRSGIRLSYQAQELLSSGDQDEYTQSVLDRIATFDAALNQRLKSMPNFDQSVVDAPMPPPERVLGADEAMVSYFITRKWKPDRQAEDPYEAVVLYGLVARKDEPSKLFALGDPRVVSTAGAEYQIAGLRGEPSSPVRGAVSLQNIETAFSDLHDQLIAPLLPAIGDAKTLFVVPDGALYSVPFSLLRDRQDKLLEERFTLRLLTRPDALYGIDTEQRMTTDNAKALLVGGLDYTNGAERGAEPLPGTLKEVRDIASMLQGHGAKVEMVTGAAASEATVRKDAEAATIAHLATHGSYESERTGGAADVDTLWQSGIILSRSGDRRNMKRDDTDGRLYAYELMDWDLTRLELLVLSACETGRGDESFISGLRGLPTAISTAGAKRSLLALWPVDDTGTEQFMVRFYEHLTGGKTYAEALRQTRRDAIDGKLPAAKDPLVWAAFVMFEN